MSQEFTVAPGEDLHAAAAAAGKVGGTVHLKAGEHVIDRTVFLHSNCLVTGDQEQQSRVVLANDASCHMFSNALPDAQNIAIEHIMFEGNAPNQSGVERGPILASVCGVYFHLATNIRLSHLIFENIKQTGAQFTRCQRVQARHTICRNLGWSGIGSTGSDGVSLEADIYDSGHEGLHSSIHIDGGNGLTYTGSIEGSTGNGVMLDTCFGPLTQMVINSTVRDCLRGVGLIGGREGNELTQVYLTGRFSNNRETGILISNSDGIFINDAQIENNAGPGLALQGRGGANNSLVTRCRFTNNQPDIVESPLCRGNRFLDIQTINRGYQSGCKSAPASSCK